MTAAEHYLSIGWKEGKSPSACFNTADESLRRPFLRNKYNPLLYAEKYESGCRRRVYPNRRLNSYGLGLVGYGNIVSGESQVFKDFAAVMPRAGVPYDISYIGGDKCFSDYRNRIVFSTGRMEKDNLYNNIPVLWWEFNSGILQARPYIFDGVTAAVVMSRFCLEYISNEAGPVADVYYVRYPYNNDLGRITSVNVTRKDFGIGADEFVCFFNFSYTSSYQRKNPEAVIDALAMAFAGRRDARLVIKTIGSREKPEQARRLVYKIYEKKLSDKVLLIDKAVRRSDMLALINMSDVYISLHRGEGLGLGMLEAMAMGKPVVATNYGGNTEFVKEGIAFPVNYKLVKPRDIDMGVYSCVDEWAEPDTEQAAYYLEKLYCDRNLRRSIAVKSTEFIKDYFSAENFRNDIDFMLKRINRI